MLQVTQAARQGFVGDFMAVWSMQLLQPEADGQAGAEGRVTATAGAVVRLQQRVAAFLQPQDPQFFDTGGKAVAVYDSEIKLTKL